MKGMTRTLTLAILLGGISQPALAGTSSLDWVLGCWTTEDGSSREVWVRHSNDELIGFAVVVAEGRVVFHELLSITVADGQAHYTAHPEGQASTTFSSSLPEGESVSFTNPGHDYPQRVDYSLEGDTLRATISLLDGSQPNHFDKVRCD